MKLFKVLSILIISLLLGTLIILPLRLPGLLLLIISNFLHYISEGFLFIGNASEEFVCYYPKQFYRKYIFPLGKNVDGSASDVK